MPLHGKIVVLKRSGGDGTEFPLTASCLFGRKPDCDIRIQLPQVSKEHCRIDLNENKEVILTNLSSVNPTSVNGQALQQSERLKHGDVITIIDRSFRFEYPPPPTPKKRSSVGGKVEATAVDPHLKDGANIDNIQRSLEKTQELESKGDTSLLESKTASPFSDLYQMIKQSLDVKTPRKSSVSILQTPSKFCTPKPKSAKKKEGTPKKAQTPVAPVENAQSGDASPQVTPKSAKKRRSVQLSKDQAVDLVQEAKPTEASPRRNATPQKFTLCEAVEQIVTQTPKSPKRKSKDTTSPVSATDSVTSPAKRKTPTKATPKSSEKGTGTSKKRKSEELSNDLPTREMKRKRVSFGGQLSPELFDKRLPPDSPLRRGATPRRSLSLYKPKQSLLRRASVIGLLKECDHERKREVKPKVKSPAKTKTPSPKKSPKAASPKTPTSAKKSPKKQSPSPKAQSPKSKAPSPGKKSSTPTKASPKSPKAQSPAQKASSPKATTPKSKSPSPGKKAATPKVQSPKTVKATPAKSPQSKPGTPKYKPQRKSTSSTDGTPKVRKPSSRTATPARSPDQTPKVQGRFSVSRIETPSPVPEEAVVAPSATVTPKIPLKRKSMKSSTKTTVALKSASKVMRRKSGLMRSSMKVMTSWADIVRFGKAKVQVGVPARAQVNKKTAKKKAGPKPQTPKQRLMTHVSTGHAASPATIVVGRAHRLRVAHSVGAPPKILTNTAVLRKNMKMDEDLTGLSEMFTTPKTARRRSTKNAPKTPQADLNKSSTEPSVLNTPEETGEMVVSPMSVASTVKGRRYNTEAVQRLLDGDEFVSELPPLDMQCEASEQGTEMNVDAPKTPKQKPLKPDALTGVKRMMKTPKQKAEPIEDLRSKLLKTPKQKSEQQECLSAVKRLVETPKEKATPVEDLKGKLLKTPKQKIQQQEECLTGVKRVMKTPKEKAQPVEDLWGKLLKTPKQKTQQQECLSAVKMLMKTPDQEEEQPESITDETQSSGTPELKTEQQDCLTGVKRVMKTPKEKSNPIEEIRGKLLLTPKQKIEQHECLTGVKRIMTTPKLKAEPVEDMVGVKRLMKTPKEKVQPVEKNFGIKRLMQSPRLRGNAPVEDFEGLEELMKEPVEEQVDVVTEETALVEQPETVPQQVINDPSDGQEVTEETVHQSESTALSLVEETEIIPSVVESVKEESAPQAKPVRGRRAKTAELTEENTQGQPEETEAPVKARRGRKVESAPEPSVKPRRGRLAKKPSKELHDESQSSTASSEPQPEDEQTSASAEQDVEHSAAQGQGRKHEADEPCDLPATSDTAQTEQETNKAMAAETQEESTVRPKKPTRGRKAVITQTQVPEQEPVPVVAQDKVDSEAAAPVRARRGKKPEAPAAPAVRPRRGRAGKAQDEVVPVETQHGESVPEQAEETCAPEATKETTQENVSEPTKEVAPEKPKRGRKVKAPVEPVQVVPEITAVEKQQFEVEAKIVDAQLELSVPKKKIQRGRRAKTQAEPPQPETEGSAVEDSTDVCEVEEVQEEQPEPPLKGRRGRRVKPADEPSPEPEITTESEPVQEEKTKRGKRARTVKDMHLSEVPQAPVHGKRSRVAKVEQEEKSEPEHEPAAESEPVKRLRRTRKDEPTEEGPTSEAADETPVIEPLKTHDTVCAAPKSRRGLHKTKEADTEAMSSDKPKRGRKGKTSEEVMAVVRPEVEQAEPAPEHDSKVKPSRGRGKTAGQPKAPDAIPAKRARRGPGVSSEQDTPVTAEPVKRGRRAVKAAASTEDSENKDQDSSTKESSHDSEAQTSKRSVTWKTDFQVIEVTPLKTARGRKTKWTGQNEGEGGNEPEKTTDHVEKNVPEKSQPATRARRGAKAAVAEETAKSTHEEKETQPKTRKGRAAKK